jgi:hypothetical protein
MEPYGRIYGLFHPVTGELRYIGQTSTTLAQRLAGHTCLSSYNQKRHSSRWVRSLLRQGLFPDIQELDTASSQEDLDTKEVGWILRCRQDGFRLTNIAVGGLGGRGPATLETRLKISRAQKGRPRKKHTVETRIRMSASHKGRRHNLPEHFQKLADAKRGVPRPYGVRAKISASKKGNPSNRKGSRHTEEARSKISESRRGQLTGGSHPQYDHSIPTEAILEYLSDGHTKVEAASHFGKSPTFIHRRLKAHRRFL